MSLAAVRTSRMAGAAAAAAGFAALPAGAADMNAVNHPAAYASGVVVGSAVPSLGAGAVLQTIVGLVVVIGLVFGCAWLARRFGFQPARRGGALKVVASVAVGGKESATVVEIGDTWLVLGVAPGNVRLLHTMPAGATTGTHGTHATQAAGGAPSSGASDAAAPTGASDDALAGSFGQRFRSALSGEVARRLAGRPPKDS